MASSVSSKVSPLFMDEFDKSKSINFAPRLCAAISKDNLVLVLGSQNIETIFLSGNKFSFL